MTRDEPEIAWMCHFDDMFLPKTVTKVNFSRSQIPFVWMRGADFGRLGLANSKDYEPTSKFFHPRLRVQSPKKHLCTCLRNITFSWAIKSCQVNKTRVCTSVKLTSYELPHWPFQVVSYQSQLWKLLDASATSWVDHLWKTEEVYFELCYLHCIAFHQQFSAIFYYKLDPVSTSPLQLPQSLETPYRFWISLWLLGEKYANFISQS